MRSVFVDTTQNRLILTDDHFTQSTKETLWPALAPFDLFLVALVRRLSFDTPAALPTEEQMERETGIGGRDQVILVSELLDCSFLVLDDRPGELPYYTLDASFDEWAGRFRLFTKVYAAWTVKQHQRESIALQTDTGEDDFEVDAPVGFGVLRGDQLPEADWDDDIDFASLDKVLRESTAHAAQRRLERPKIPKQSFPPITIVIPKPKVPEQQQVDAFLAKLLTTVAGGRSFNAQNWNALAQNVAHATATSELIAKLALDPVSKHTKVFLVADTGGQCALSVNPMLSWDMLLRYPKTRAVCDKLLGAA